MSDIETWVEIPETSGFYQASSLGRIRSIDRTIIRMNRWGLEGQLTIKGRVIKPWADSNGYLVVYICGNGRRQAINVHRLVAMAFIPHPLQSELDVNHLDGLKQNNRTENLEWCTRKQNMEHALKYGLFDQRKPLVAVPTSGGKPVLFGSSKEAAEILGVSSRQNISSAAAGKLRQAYGYFWSYQNA